MPIYEYRCAACGKRFEEFMKMSDPPLDTCVECGVTGQVTKLVSATAFHLKGGGWYADHYGLKGGGGETTAAPPSDSPSSDSSSSDSGSSSSDGGSSSDSAAPAAAPSSDSSSPSAD